MKLESVVKQIISEQVTPIQVMLKLIKGLGKKGAAEAESALIRAIRKEGNFGAKVKINPSDVSEEIFMKSVANIEFASYRKLITQKIYNGNQQLYDDIIKKYSGGKWTNKQRIVELTNAGIPPVLQPEVKELYNLKNKIVKPKSKKPVKTKEEIATDLLRNSITDEQSLKNYLVNELKEYSLPAMYKGKEQKYINEIWAIIDKETKGAITKYNKTVKDLEIFIDRLSYNERETLLKKALEGIKKSNKTLWDKFSQNFKFWSDPQYKSLSTMEKYKQTIQMSGYINIATAILDLTRLFFETENTEGLDWQGHFGFSPGTTITMKVGSAAIPRMNVFLSTVLFAESFLRNVYEYSGLRKNIEGSKPGTAPFTSDGTGNPDDLEGIKN